MREAAGIFDVSHMGQIHVSGVGAERSLERLLTCRVSSLPIGTVRYGCLCNEDGGTIDDITLYRLKADEFFLCVNAANVAKDLAWILSEVSDAKITDQSTTTSLLALQGPRAQDILKTLGITGIQKIKRFQFRNHFIENCQVLISRTGYTGNDGFELYFSASESEKIWRALIGAGETFGLKAAGLGARDTLRLEAAYPLYGQELTDATSPLQAGLHRFVKVDEGGFIGHAAIKSRASIGNAKVLIGFLVEGHGIARTNYPLIGNGQNIGHVTSGTSSPTLDRYIGLGYVEPQFAQLKTQIQVIVRNKPINARVCKTPFVPFNRYTPQKSGEERT